MQRAASTPFMPGMCTSRNTTCGLSSSNSSTASRPLRACATTCSSGHSRARCAASCSRSSGSSSAISAVARPWRVMGGGHHANLGAHAVRRLSSSATLDPAPKNACSRSCRLRRPEPVPAPSDRPTPVSATHRSDLATGVAPRADLDAAAVATRVDAVADRVLDQGQQPICGNGSARSAGSMSSVNVSRSGMRISISSR